MATEIKTIITDETGEKIVAELQNLTSAVKSSSGGSTGGSSTPDISGLTSTLNDNSWEKIRAASDAGVAQSWWKIGDTKTILVSGTMGTLSISDNYDVFIIGFDHNAALEGTNRIHFQGFKTTAGVDVGFISNYNSSNTSGNLGYFNMNHWGNYNYGGWAACDMRYDILGSTNMEPVSGTYSSTNGAYGYRRYEGCKGQDPTADCATSPKENTLMSCLPEDLRAVMKPITKWTNNIGWMSYWSTIENELDEEEKDSGSYLRNMTIAISASLDYLPLLSEFEVLGTNGGYSNRTEWEYQKQYEYYRNGNSRVKYRHSATSSTAYWWLRSPNYDINSNFCGVSTSGHYNYSSASYSYAVSPAFAV
ncbi:MAG: DUF6273 domain-containing protein [Clostridia bacterium]|nr:DUF6273 domain-containing protein [Clostridia bacterium]